MAGPSGESGYSYGSGTWAGNSGWRDERIEFHRGDRQGNFTSVPQEDVLDRNQPVINFDFEEQDADLGERGPGGYVAEALWAAGAKVRRRKWLMPWVTFLVAFLFQSIALCVATWRYIVQMEKLHWSVEGESSHAKDMVAGYLELRDNFAAALGHQEQELKKVPVDLVCWALPVLWAFVALRSRNLRQWTRTLFVAASLALLKGVFACGGMPTSLTGMDMCRQRLNPQLLQLLGKESWNVPDVLLSILNVACVCVQDLLLGMRYQGDLVCASGLSGPTYLCTLACLSLYDAARTASRKTKPKFRILYHWVAALLLSAVVLADASLDVVTRRQYTVDVVLALIITMLLYGSPVMALCADRWLTSGLYETPWLKADGKDSGDLVVPPCCVPFCCLHGRYFMYSVSVRRAEEAQRLQEEAKKVALESFAEQEELVRAVLEVEAEIDCVRQRTQVREREEAADTEMRIQQAVAQARHVYEVRAEQQANEAKALRNKQMQMMEPTSNIPVDQQVLQENEGERPTRRRRPSVPLVFEGMTATSKRVLLDSAAPPEGQSGEPANSEQAVLESAAPSEEHRGEPAPSEQVVLDNSAPSEEHRGEPAPSEQVVLDNSAPSEIVEPAPSELAVLDKAVPSEGQSGEPAPSDQVVLDTSAPSKGQSGEPAPSDQVVLDTSAPSKGQSAEPAPSEQAVLDNAAPSEANPSATLNRRCPDHFWAGLHAQFRQQDDSSRPAPSMANTACAETPSTPCDNADSATSACLGSQPTEAQGISQSDLPSDISGGERTLVDVTLAAQYASEIEAAEQRDSEVHGVETKTAETSVIHALAAETTTVTKSPTAETVAEDLAKNPSAEAPVVEAYSNETPPGEIPPGETPQGETPPDETPSGETVVSADKIPADLPVAAEPTKSPDDEALGLVDNSLKTEEFEAPTLVATVQVTDESALDTHPPDYVTEEQLSTSGGLVGQPLADLQTTEMAGASMHAESTVTAAPPPNSADAAPPQATQSGGLARFMTEE